MKVIYAGESLPQSITKTLFLASPEDCDLEKALVHLEECGYDGHVFLPKPRNHEISETSEERFTWIFDAMHASDVILFYMPKHEEKTAFCSACQNFGVWTSIDPSRLVLVTPEKSCHTAYQTHTANRRKMPVFDDLSKGLDAALAKLGDGAVREGGECKVPLHLWTNRVFQSWYQTQKRAGNELHRARVQWVYLLANKHIFSWAMLVDIYVKSEQRNKSNEVVFSRPDLGAVVAWSRPESGLLDDTLVALVREFRSPGDTADDGFVWDLPSGSTFKPLTMKEMALMEFSEELGMNVSADRLVAHGARQKDAAFSVHKAHVYSLEFETAELEQVRSAEANGVTYGVERSSERTYPRIMTFGQLRRQCLCDWSTIGIIYQVLTEVGMR